ncbi:MAG TPA: hypothetical protein VMR89_03655 [Actinomycetota bacterium]|nr:hypothetical protein [Actinomycetota bacterium]
MPAPATEYEVDPGLWAKVLAYRGKAEWVAVSDTEVVAAGVDARAVLKEGARHTADPTLIRVPGTEVGSYIL